MIATSTRRLPKAQRRSQLLDTAREIVRDQGTDALTLGALAERAGVSKPIAYEHFGTRSGLLIALYKRIDESQVEALNAALQRAPRRLEDVARVASDAYMHCYLSLGPEGHAIAAALKGGGDMEAVQQELIDHYVAFYCEMLAPYSDLPPDDLRLRCAGIIGAGEALALEMTRGRIDEQTAAASLASLIVAWISAET